MAPIVAWLAGYIGSFWAGVVVAVAKIAASYMLSRALSPKPGKLGSMGSPIQMTREAAAPRRVIYGETRVSGPIVFAHVSGDKNKYIDVVVALAGHECAEVGAVLINDEQVSLDSSGLPLAGSKYEGKLQVWFWYGDDAERTALMANAPGVWTSAHRLRGITAMHVRMEFDQEAYPQGLPNLSAVVRGKIMEDPRVSESDWSDNPALCLLDYLRDADVGFAAEDAEIDIDSFTYGASICDESVALLSGGTEKRYRCCGVFAADGEPAAIIEQILGTMAGSLIYVGGKFVLKVGAYEVPSVTLTESDMRGPIQFQTDSSRREICNIVKGTYTSPVDLYQPRDFPQYVDAAAITADGGEEITRDLALDWVHSPAQAQRLAAIEEKSSRLGGAIVLQCNLSALRVQVGDSVTIQNQRFGWTEGEVFRVVEFKFSAADGAIGIDLTCRRTAPSIYGWLAADNERPVVPGDVPNSDPGYTIPGIDDLIPGTYDDLNGDGDSYPVPSGSILKQVRGGTWGKRGFASLDLSEPSRRWLTKSLSGTTVSRSHASPEPSSDYIRTTETFSGAFAIDPGTNVASGQWDRHQLFVYADNSTAENEWYAGTTSEYFVGNSIPTVLDQDDKVSHLRALTSATLAANAYVTGNYWAVESASAAITLASEDTKGAAAARMMESADWMTPAIVDTAINTVPTSSPTGVLREIRFGTYIPAVGEGEPTYTELTGMQAYQRYHLVAALETRAVDENGSATGDGEWTSAGVAYSEPWVTGGTGTGGATWKTIEAPEGFEIRATVTAQKY